MANISDGYGTVVVEKVGQELKDFLTVVQEGAYYLLFDDVENIEVFDNGNAEFQFGAGGRWNYEANIRGYLEGDWMTGEKEKKAYNKFIRAFKKKDGLISIEYTDSDTAMDWMGEGQYNMSVCEKEIIFDHNFEERPVTLEDYAELNGYSMLEAIEYLYGDEVAGAYQDYEVECDQKGTKPVEPDVWYDTIYSKEV